MIYRSAFILPAASRSSANALAANIGIDPQSKLNTLSVGLVAKNAVDTSPASFYGACGILTQLQRTKLEEASGNFPGAKWWRWEELDPDRKVVASWNGENIGQPWSWRACMESAGVKNRRKIY